jgi:uncharacterized protein YjbJ (UPF0337 family)
MPEYNNPIKWQQVRGKKRAHWGILTLDDLPKTNGKYSLLIAQLQARYKAAKESGDNKPK